MDIVVSIYEITEFLPKSEIYGLTSQMRRSSISIPSNVAEGTLRGTRKDYCNFIFMAFASGGELETQIELLKRLPFGKNLDYLKSEKLLDEVMKMLNVLIQKLKPIY